MSSLSAVRIIACYYLFKLDSLLAKQPLMSGLSSVRIIAFHYLSNLLACLNGSF